MIALQPHLIHKSMTEQNDTDKAKKDQALLKKQVAKFFAVVIITSGAALYLMIKEIQPARYFMDLQSGWFDGKYYPKATFAVLWIIMLLAFAAVYSFIDWMIRLIKGKK
jgi:hypothetical protein